MKSATPLTFPPSLVWGCDILFLKQLLIKGLTRLAIDLAFSSLMQISFGAKIEKIRIVTSCHVTLAEKLPRVLRSHQAAESPSYRVTEAAESCEATCPILIRPRRRPNPKQPALRLKLRPAAARSEPRIA
ncbi:unnamed protein product [Lactuca saligna]|uniref:Uncharacterized protein n=1 Tax=Lactuca saligna TaxID=75948 RepID=A0AA35ZUC4_LACSI|nr:unnamed protein product [Lactuca saligna]